MTFINVCVFQIITINQSSRSYTKPAPLFTLKAITKQFIARPARYHQSPVVELFDEERSYYVLICDLWLKPYLFNSTRYLVVYNTCLVYYMLYNIIYLFFCYIMYVWDTERYIYCTTIDAMRYRSKWIWCVVYHIDCKISRYITYWLIY